MERYKYRKSVKNNNSMILDYKGDDLIEKAEEVWFKLDSNNENTSD